MDATWSALILVDDDPGVGPSMRLCLAADGQQDRPDESEGDTFFVTASPAYRAFLETAALRGSV